MIYKNLRLEVGTKETQLGLKTIVDTFDIEVEDGIIKNIAKNISKDGYNCNNFLLLPSFCDNHIHLDKGHYGGKWQAVIPMNSVSERIKEEEGFLHEFENYIDDRGQALIDLIGNNGVLDFKVQVNIDPIIGLNYVKKVKNLLDKNNHILNYKLVAFPQHGFLKSINYMEEALKLNLVDEIGGVDPANIDYDIEKTLYETFRLAKQYDKKIDIHLHDPSSLGLYEINRIIHYTKEFSYKSKVEISHAFALSSCCKDELKQLASEFIKYDIGLNTTVPLGYAFDFVTLMNEGVKISIINDNINDHWSPFGSGDLLERASRGAEYFNQVDEWSLNRILKTITKNHITPLDDNGNMVWPKIGDRADFILINAECSSHAIARIPKSRIVIKNGSIIFDGTK